MHLSLPGLPTLLATLATLPLALPGPQSTSGLDARPSAWNAPDTSALAAAAGTPVCLATSGCPCGNDNPTGGCLNSTGSGASLNATGTTSVAADDLVLTTIGAPPGNSGLFVMGTGGPADTPAPLGDGLACVGGVFRFAPGVVNATGNLSLASPGAQAPAGTIAPGVGRVFQAWTRDVLCGPPPSPCPSPCGTGNNISSGCLVVFTP